MLAQVTVQSQEEPRGQEFIAVCVGVFELGFLDKTSLGQQEEQRQQGHLKTATQLNNFHLGFDSFSATPEHDELRTLSLQIRVLGNCQSSASFLCNGADPRLERKDVLTLVAWGDGGRHCPS